MYRYKCDWYHLSLSVYNLLLYVVLQEKGDKDGEEKKPGEGEEGDGENEELEEEEEDLGDDDYAQVHDTSEYFSFLCSMSCFSF